MRVGLTQVCEAFAEHFSGGQLQTAQRAAAHEHRTKPGVGQLGPVLRSTRSAEASGRRSAVSSGQQSRISNDIT